MPRNIQSKKKEQQDIFDFYGSPTDPWFCCIRDRSDLREARDHLNRMWIWFQSCGLQDTHFESEFRLNFCHRWWELQVAWFLKTIGCKITHENEGPDFICSKDGVTFYVEAVTCSPGEQTRSDSVKPLPNGSFKLEEQQRLELLRFTQAIREKTRKYWKFRRKKIVESGIPFVIALSPIQISLERILTVSASLQRTPAILKAVYGEGINVISVDRSSGKFGATYSQNRPALLKNNATVRTDRFRPTVRRCDPYKCVSGILYSELNFASSFPYAYPCSDEILADRSSSRSSQWMPVPPPLSS